MALTVGLLSRGAHPLHRPGGMERAVYHLARHLERRGVETVLFTRPATEAGSFPGRVVTLPYGGSEHRHGRILDRTLRYPRFARQVGMAVAREVRAGRIDLVDAQGLTALGYGRLRRRDPTLAAPLVMNPQGMEEHRTRGLKRLALGRLRALSREAASLADAVIATDESTRDDVTRLLGVEPARVRVVPNAVDLEEISSLTPRAPERVVAEAFPVLARARPLLLSVGRIEAYKGFGDTLDALLALEGTGSLPEGWAWAVVGDGPERGELTERARAGLGSATARHVLWLGRISDRLLHALYARADLFVHATRYEGSSLVTLEAMAHGLPVVAARAGGIPDKVEDRVSGRLVPPGDVPALAQAIADVVGSGGRALGEAGRERVRRAFDWATVVDRMLELYESLRVRGAS